VSAPSSTRGQPRDLNGRLVLITGAGSGVGLECARVFAAQGAKLLLVGRSADKLEAAAAELAETRAQTAICAGDVTDSAFATTAMAAAQDAFGAPVEVLINNAGVIVRRDAVETSDDEWRAVMQTNVDGVFYLSRAFAQQLVYDGAIVNVSSTCGVVGAAGLAAYCTSKGALNQLTRTMALEFADKQINVNAVAPGAINSPMLFSEHATQAAADSVVERNQSSIPIGDVAQPEEVARAILFLATERHVTGTILSLDGGYTAN
jgi:meso-butanediol dehydrogenase/(S,S)-butanediol dehydrogenase/diacetyl reductase